MKKIRVNIVADLEVDDNYSILNDYTLEDTDGIRLIPALSLEVFDRTNQYIEPIVTLFSDSDLNDYGVHIAESHIFIK